MAGQGRHIGQFEQVVVNLAVNARDAMPDGGELTIRTRNVTGEECKAFHAKGMPAADYVVVEVEDTGTGIAPRSSRRSSSRSSPPRRSARAPGSACRWSTASSSRPAASSTAIPSRQGLDLPHLPAAPRRRRRKRPERAAEPRRRRLGNGRCGQGEQARGEGSSGRGTVLLVEDEDGLRGRMRALTSRGYTVHEASGVEALEVFEKADGKVDIVVSDVVMPEMDGPTLLGELRKRNPTSSSSSSPATPRTPSRRTCPSTPSSASCRSRSRSSSSAPS